MEAGGRAATSTTAGVNGWDAEAARSAVTELRRNAEGRVDGVTVAVLAGGAEKPRDLPIPGRDLDGIHFAMDFLPQQNRRVGDEPVSDAFGGDGFSGTDIADNDIQPPA